MTGVTIHCRRPKYWLRPIVIVQGTKLCGEHTLCKAPWKLLHMYYVCNSHNDPLKSILPLSSPLHKPGNRLNKFNNLPKILYPARGRARILTMQSSLWVSTLKKHNSVRLPGKIMPRERQIVTSLMYHFHIVCPVLQRTPICIFPSSQGSVTLLLDIVRQVFNF